MSDPVDRIKPPRKPTRRVMIWSMWGREQVKDFVLLFAAIPVLLCLVQIPIVASSGGSWPRLLGLFVLFVAVWWVLRLLLRRWVGAGDEGGDPPSRG